MLGEHLHMTGVTEVLSGLISAFVGTHLQIDNAFSGSELLVREVAFVFFGGLGTDERSLELRMEVALEISETQVKNKKTLISA